MDSSQNSLIMYLCAYVEGIFTDIRDTYTKNHDWERDKTRLQHEVKVRGSQVMTIDLPSTAKLLDRALDQGSIQPFGVYLGRCRKGEQVPVFLRDLFIQIFDPISGMLRSEPSLRAVVDLRQLLLGGKKLLLPCSERRVRDEVRDFIKTESGNRRYTLDWGNDAPLSSDHRVKPGAQERIHLVDSLLRRELDHPRLFNDPEPCEGHCSRRELSLTQTVFDWVASEFGDLAEERETELPKHGPGAVSDLRRGMSKYSFRDWPSKLENVFPFDAYAVHDFMCSAGIEPIDLGRNREVPSRLISVPKTQKSPRLIAAEPSQYQWVQQLLRSQLEGRLRTSRLRHAIEFDSQLKNQEAATVGSLYPDTFVSVDLSSASDRLTCWLVERFARSNNSLLDRLHACRTRWNRNDVVPSEGQFILLRKYATMGSAVIFPLQTIIYASLAVSAILLSEQSEHKRVVVSGRRIEDASHRVRVFGDDILLPRHAYECLRRLLTHLGLKVNTAKTYTGSNFRESCGVDAFRGVNVTPAYLRQDFSRARLSNVDSPLEVSNNFWRRGYWHTATWLDSFTSKWDRMIPTTGPTTTALGRLSFCGSSINHLKRRWNVDLHRYEVRVLSSYSKVRRTPGTGRQNLMQWFIEKPAPDLLWKAGTDSVKVSSSRPGWQDLSLYGMGPTG